ncbi:MAG: hypothetical protein M1821_008165 [Bathelium mastoideum]|nr:MAG: hypothetical protein M1821_008165 [Bathelium mastoideum]KAI9693210.1 MAG: hypothetical protein M1822_005206 [Bathelium mastoideum]
MTAVANGLPNGTTTNGTHSHLKITKRPWNERGQFDQGWLYTFYTFDFANYRSDSNDYHESFGPLRVLNEDRVARGTGFGLHSHAEFLIWSYVVAGELEHRDSMGNVETLRRGDVQFTSAGTGIRHSEYNRNETTDNHFLQVWATPRVSGLTPSYKTNTYPDKVKTDRLCRIMESVDRYDGKDEESSPIPLEADISMDACILSPGKSVQHEVVKEGQRKVFVHMVMSERKQPSSGGPKIRVGDVELGEGDGAYVEGVTGPGSFTVESIGDSPAEFLLFDMTE